MALASPELPTAPKAGVARRLRPHRPARRRHFERIGRPDSLATPSDLAYRSAGIHEGLR